MWGANPSISCHAFCETASLLILITQTMDITGENTLPTARRLRQEDGSKFEANVNIERPCFKIK